MRRLFVLLFTILSICASSTSSSSKGHSGASNSDKEILLHIIHFAHGGGARGGGARGGGGFHGGRSPGVGEGGNGGSGLPTPKLPGGAAVIPVTTGGGAIRNRHGGHHSRASHSHSFVGLLPLVTTMLAVFGILISRI